MENIEFIVGIVILVLGLLMIVSPRAMRKLSNFLNRVVFTDSKIFGMRGISGTAFVICGIFLVIVSNFCQMIWGEFLWGGETFKLGLLVVGIISILFGILFLFKPMLIIRMSDLGNRVLFSDDKLDTNPRIVGVVLVAAGSYMIYQMLPI